MASTMGGFVAGSIVGKLLLDKSGWNQSIAGVEQDKKKLQGTVKQLGSTFAMVGRQLTMLAAGAAASFLAMAKVTADAGDEIAKLSKKVGVSTETLSGYKLAAEMSGSSLEGFAMGMRRLSSNMVDSERGLAESVRSFKALGISVKDSKGNIKGLEPILLEVADRFSQMKDGATKAALAQDLFGRSGADMIPLLNQGAEGLKRHREEAEKLGTVFSEKAAKACEEFNDSLTRLAASIQGMRKNIVMSALPVLTEVANKLSGFVAQVGEAISKNSATIAKSVLWSFNIIIKAVEGVMLAFNAFKMAVFKVGEAIADYMINRLIPLAVVTDALATKLGLFKEVNAAVFLTMKNLLFISQEYHDQADKSLETMTDIVSTFDDLKKSLEDAAKGFELTGKNIKDPFIPNLKTVTTTIEEGFVPQAREMRNILESIPPTFLKIVSAAQQFRWMLKRAAAEFNISTEEMTKRLAVLVAALMQLQGIRTSPQELLAAWGHTTMKIVDLWKSVNQQIEAAWVQGISRIITEFRSFGDSLKTIANNILRIFGDVIGMIVVEWVKGLLKIKGATKITMEHIKVALQALAVFIAVDWLTQLLGAIGIIHNAADDAVDKILKKMEEAKKAGEELLDTINKIALANQGAGTPRRSDKTRQGEDLVDVIKKNFEDLFGSLNIPERLASLISGVRTSGMLSTISRITKAVVNLMIAQGKTLYETLMSLKEPLTMLRDKYRVLTTEVTNFANGVMIGEQIGDKVPKYLQAIFGLLDKMEERPGLWKRMDDLLNIFKMFVETGALTQGLFVDMTNSVKGFARQILDLTGNLREAIGNMGELTQEQILMLAPLLAPFLQAAQQFGLKLPGWIQDLANKAGIKIVDQPIAKVPGKLDIIARRIDKGVIRIIDAIKTLGKRGFQHGGIAWEPQFARVAERGPEAIIPLSDMSKFCSLLSRRDPQVNVNMASTPVILNVNGRELIRAMADHSVKDSKYGRIKWHGRAITG